MRTPRNRTVFGLESLEPKLLLSSLAPIVATHPESGPALTVDRAVATPMNFSRNTVFLTNNTGIKIRIRAGFGRVTDADRAFDVVKGGRIRFDFGDRQGFIFVSIEKAPGESSTVPKLVSKSLNINASSGGYYGKEFTVGITLNSFDVSN